jgi:D-alanyl-D-alanine carboxypeptidase/D-alanyl-D-alanine carboxypeptidase (penicillin-binding protein 5/6)
LDTKVTISKESVDSEGSTLDLEVGEKYSVEDLLYALILTSANDVANSLAEFIGGDIDKFVVLMNSKASELNMKNTHFSNPSGLYNEQQFTTASDIAILMRYALNNPDFNTIFSCAAKPWTTKNGVEVLTNQNDLFWSYDGVDGGKTGYNNKKQQSAITTATHLGQRLICIVLDSPDNDSMLEDSTKLFDYGFKNFRTGILVSKDHSLRVIQINNQEVNLVSKNDIYYTFPVGQSYIKSLNFDMATDMKPPVSINLIAGTARYTLADDTIIDVSLYPDTEINVPEDSLTSAIKKIKENKDIMLLLNILILTEVFLVLYNIFKLIRRLTGRLIKNKGKSA